MPLESKKTHNGDIISLASEYVTVLYTSKGDQNNQKAIQIKNKIAVLLGGMYQDILDGYLAGKSDKQMIFGFVNLVNKLVGTGVMQAQNNIFSQLLEKNISLATNEDQIQIIKKFIQSEIDKNIQGARREMDSVVELFRERCLEILLEKQKGIHSMLQMSHSRDKGKIKHLSQRVETLDFENQRLNGEITILTETNSTLTGKVVELSQTVEKQALSLRGHFKEWTKLNGTIKDLEKEKQGILTYLESIEKELAGKKRKLQGGNLVEKVQGILNFIRTIQSQETTWQQTFVNQQNFDRTEQQLRGEISQLSTNLEIAKTIAKELNEELENEQRKNQILTSSDERVIKDALGSQMTDYFYFLFQSNEFVNQTKQTELELALKMTYYRAKVLHLNMIVFVEEHVQKLVAVYKKSHPDQIQRVEGAGEILEHFIKTLEYGNDYFRRSIERYKDVVEM